MHELLFTTKHILFMKLVDLLQVAMRIPLGNKKIYFNRKLCSFLFF